MIYLKRDVVNNVIYTAKEYSFEPIYTCKIENQQSLDTKSFYLYNNQASGDRYDSSLVKVLTGTTTAITYDTLSGVTTTTLTGFLSGYYNYTIHQNNNTQNIYEVGKLLIESIDDPNIYEYTPTDTNYVYEPYK